MMGGQAVTWSIAPAVAGVSVASNGIVTVATDCAAESFRLRADCGAASGTFTVTVVPAATQAPQQVTNLDVTLDNWNNFYIEFTMPAVLPYPVQYVLEAIDVNDPFGPPMVLAGSYPYTSTPTNDKYSFDLYRIAKDMSPGAYTLQVVTVDAANSSNRSAPVVYGKTLVVNPLLGPINITASTFQGLDAPNAVHYTLYTENTLPTYPDDPWYFFVDVNIGQLMAPYNTHTLTQSMGMGGNALEIMLDLSSLPGPFNESVPHEGTIYRFIPPEFGNDTVTVWIGESTIFQLDESAPAPVK